jgi:hypothetical protein
MQSFDYAERPHARRTAPDRAPATRLPPLQQAVIDLNRAAGNRAVGQLLSRQPVKTKTSFVGDGKHKNTDVRYATEVGKADVARLKDKMELSSDERDDISAKRSWFQGAARAAYVAEVGPALRQILEPVDMSDDPAVQADRAEWRQGIKQNINGDFNSIQKLEAERISSWEKNANLPDSKLGLAVLEAVIAIVSLGLGGVAYGIISSLIEKKLASKLLEEFILLAGLEAADLAAEKAFHVAVDLVRTDMETARQRTQRADKAQEDAKAALTSKGDSVAAYAEALRLQSIRQEAEEREVFNNSSKDLTDAQLLQKHAALKIIYGKLLESPTPYMQKLTTGYIRLLDEAKLSQKDKDHGGSRERTFKEDRDAHQITPRAGNLVVWPLPTQFPLGSWANPNTGFGGLMAQGTGVNSKTLETLEGVPLKDLKVTLSLFFTVQSPYLLWPGDRKYEMPLIFVRNPDGVISPPDDDEMREWLASYYTGQSSEHSDDQRDLFAPLGANKLYEKIKDKRITDTEHVR